jgi:hypothetical protein
MHNLAPQQFPKRRTMTSHRAPNVVDENRDWVIAEWLKRVKANPELSLVSLSETERTDHVPDLLQQVIAEACGHGMRVDDRQKAAERHGTLRFHQGYSVAMLILEAQILQRVIAECIRDHFQIIDLEHLIPDIAKIYETITEELGESSRAYMKQFEWHGVSVDLRSRRK